MLSTNCDIKNQTLATQYERNSIISGPTVYMVHTMDNVSQQVTWYCTRAAKNHDIMHVLLENAPFEGTCRKHGTYPAASEPAYERHKIIVQIQFTNVTLERLCV